MTVQEVVIRYESQLGELETGLTHLRLPHALTGTILAIAIGLFLTLSLYAMARQASFFWPLLPVPLAAASVRRFQRDRHARSRIWRLRRFYQRALQRVRGNWAGSGDNGEEFSDRNHVYSHVYKKDLNIFGEGSLFERLCIARTSIGQRGLANYLLETPVLEETLQRQEAVREMVARVDLREKVATLGEFEFFESRASTFEEWLDSPKLSFARPLPLVTAITSALLAALVLAAFTASVPWATVQVRSARWWSCTRRLEWSTGGA